MHDYSGSQVDKQTMQSFPLTKTLNLTTPWLFNGRVLLPKETRNKLPDNCGILLDFTDGEEKEEHGTIARLKTACALSLSLCINKGQGTLLYPNNTYTSNNNSDNNKRLNNSNED